MGYLATTTSSSWKYCFEKLFIFLNLRSIIYRHTNTRSWFQRIWVIFINSKTVHAKVKNYQENRLLVIKCNYQLMFALCVRPLWRQSVLYFFIEIYFPSHKRRPLSFLHLRGQITCTRRGGRSNIEMCFSDKLTAFSITFVSFVISYVCVCVRARACVCFQNWENKKEQTETDARNFTDYERNFSILYI